MSFYARLSLRSVLGFNLLLAFGLSFFLVTQVVFNPLYLTPTHFQVFVGLLVYILLLFILYHWAVFRPLVRLNRSLSRFDSGDYDTPFVGAGYTEITELAQTLDNLRLKLKYSQTIIKSDANYRQYVEERLTYALAHAEEASRIKSTFLNQITPEFQSPLSRISEETHSILTKDPTLAHPTETSCQTILKNVATLSDFLETVLSLSQLEKGTLSPDITAVNVHQICFDIFTEFDPFARDKSLIFQVIQDPTLPEFIYTDADRLLQILRNLMTNAFQYTTTGAVVFHIFTPTPNDCVHYEISDKHAFIGFSVEDSGNGFTSSHGPTSDPFIASKPTQEHAGAIEGLGLSLCHHLAHSLYSRLHIESRVEEGSSFKLFIPSRPTSNLQ